MIPIRCGACGKASQIDESWLGRQVACPHCRSAMLAAAETPAKHAPAAPPLPPPLPPPPPPPPPTTTAKTATAAPPPKATPASASPATPAVPPAPPPDDAPPAAPPRRPLTHAQRDAIRRRRHLILAIGGALALAATAATLLALS